MRSPAILVCLASCLAVSACAMEPLAAPSATMDNIQTIRNASIAPMNVGTFTAGPGAPTDMNKNVTVRGGVQSAPGGTFSKYLADTIAAQLKGAGKLDPNASLTVSGVLTDTHVDSAMSTATARLAAKFTLTRDGKTVFEKTLSVNDSWQGAFVGAEAIPDALNHYTGLFPKLANALFADADFEAAAHAQP